MILSRQLNMKKHKIFSVNTISTINWFIIKLKIFFINQFIKILSNIKHITNKLIICRKLFFSYLSFFLKLFYHSYFSSFVSDNLSSLLSFLGDNYFSLLASTSPFWETLAGDLASPSPFWETLSGDF